MMNCLMELSDRSSGIVRIVQPKWSKGPVINYGERGVRGFTKWEKCGSETFCATPLKTGYNIVCPLLKGGHFLCLSSLQYG